MIMMSRTLCYFSTVDTPYELSIMTAHWPCVTDFSAISLDLRAHGHREGDEHPLRSNLGAWYTLPFLFRASLLCWRNKCVRNVYFVCKVDKILSRGFCPWIPSWLTGASEFKHATQVWLAFSRPRERLVWAAEGDEISALHSHLLQAGDDVTARPRDLTGPSCEISLPIFPVDIPARGRRRRRRRAIFRRVFIVPERSTRRN